MAKTRTTIKRSAPAKAERARERGPARLVNARYDAAQTTDDNRRHWAYADHLSANAANGTAVRRTLRNRARYEVANNSYAKGMVLTLANDTIGTGPRLHLTGVDSKTSVQVHKIFSSWTKKIKLAEKLRTMRMSKCVDGESFALLANNPRVDHDVKLDLKVYECDQIGDPLFIPTPEQPVEGIVLDEFGNPRDYKILKQHPGDVNVVFSLRPETVPADKVLHYFRSDRPGQCRGIPELTPALPLFAMLRDYTLATLDAAKAAAAYAGILYTDAPAEDADDVVPMDAIELQRNALVTMPNGWKLSQVEAKHPTSTYESFKKEVLNEAARCLNMPFNVAACNSSSYNYSSGRMDHQVYFKALRVEQSFIDAHLLDRIFEAWIAEAVLVEGLLPQAVRARSFEWQHSWFWDGAEHVDPQKEAQAQDIRLRNNTTTLAIEYAKQNRDWEVEIDQRAREVKKCATAGVTNAAEPQPVATEEDDGQNE